VAGARHYASGGGLRRFFRTAGDRLTDAVRNVVRYDIRHGDGPKDDQRTRRERYTDMGRPPPEPDVPAEGAWLWVWFWEVAAARPEQGAPLSWGELAAWQRLTGEIVQPHEARLLMRMDAAYRDQLAIERAAAQEGKRP
jgi:hypothetical protein